MEESAPRPTEPPDDEPCWAGAWTAVDGLTEVWAQAAVIRAVCVLPTLHPWRLGDERGSSRVIQWVGRRGERAPSPLAVLTVTARDPLLDDDDTTPDVRGLMRLARPAAPQWAGALVRLPGTWLPPVAWLPESLRDITHPRTAWQTESVAFARRWSVHSEDLRTSAALLTPAVMALAMDTVPAATAVTIAGDALHLWWPYEGPALRTAGRVAAAADAAAGLAAAFPRFVLTDHPDRSASLDDAHARRKAAAAAYRAARRTRQAAARAAVTRPPDVRHG